MNTRRSFNAIIVVTSFTAMFFLVAVCPASAQQKFPDWMDEVKFDSSSRQGLNEPDMPIDPATGKAAEQRPTRKGFRPELPDFSKMREKAIKMEMERKQKDANSLEESYSMSLKNLDQLKEGKSRLELLLAANPGENERLQLLEGLKDIEDKIKASEELQALIGNASATPGQAIASLTADQFARAARLQKQIFSDKNGAAGIKSPAPPSQAAALADETESDEEIAARAAKLRHRPYRPGRIKSFYRESKEAQKKAAEEGNDE
ncbi:MAG: hypothetical protein CVV42_01370 [Candidatus Riflebacteria bacterium HGW-Riflebacteria-2]|jgi:hypothetical protein|nr:MAG: hypothetical protein CVV42_01370 [Candidatus Riflebacteria bacterium HGW-Riflebacteria-2]